MNKKPFPLIMALLVLAGCGGTSGSSDSAATGGAPSLMADATPVTPAPTDNRQFLITTYQDGLNEIQQAQLALQKSTNNDVKRFAQRMIDDHTRLNSAITQLAQARNIALPTGLSVDQQTQATRLATLTGDAFDLAYMAGNVAAHDRDATAARQQTRVGTDADVQRLAEVCLPILQVHLAVAEKVNTQLDPAAFLATVYQGSLAQIQWSQLALQKSTNSDVRQFAQRMIDDYTKANNSIAALALQKGIPLPGAASLEAQAVTTELAAFSGADFDQTYMDKNVIAHAKTVWFVKTQAEQGRDADVKRLAQEGAPALVLHLAGAVYIDRRIEPSFLYRAYQDGKAEILESVLALQQSTNNEVKSFAQQMITDHTAVNTQIAQLAQQRNVALPIDVSPGQLRSILKLARNNGPEFDRLYINRNVRDHQKDVADTTTQAQSAADTGLQAFAQNALPVLTAHLNRATQLQLQQLQQQQQPGAAQQH